MVAFNEIYSELLIQSLFLFSFIKIFIILFLNVLIFVFIQAKDSIETLLFWSPRTDTEYFKSVFFSVKSATILMESVMKF